jgi:adenylosuccinate synthase
LVHYIRREMGKVCGVFDCVLGDSGKGKLVDYLAGGFDLVVKGSGGPNTGASVEVDGKRYKFHHLPVSVLRNKPSYIGSPCLIYPPKLREEIEYAKSLGMEEKNLKISPNCSVITEDHILRDCAAESNGAGIGSTKRGISPCSSDKYARKGIRIETLKEFERYFADVPYEINQAINAGQNILFAGTQGFWLDLDYGNVPYVSTTCVTSAAMGMCGIGPTKVSEVIGVTKCYSTYVGTGPYMTEIEDSELKSYIAEKGREYGTTTNRPRRIGFIDLPALKYACMANGCTSLAITKSDILLGKSIKYCVAYKLDGQVIDHPPVCRSDYNRCIPVYNEVDVKTGREFIQIIEEATGIPVKYFSFGAGREQIEEL